MNRRRYTLLAVLLTFAGLAQAQYTQLGKTNEFMLKIELGYAPFMGNRGTAGEHGYYLDKFHNAAGLNVMAGSNISQDWFVGGGLGFNYYHNLQQGVVTPLMGLQVFADADFRPIWKGVMGLDYQPVTIKWAPVIGARVGASYLMGEAEPEGYGPTLTPMVELSAGVNWYYKHGLRNMSHNFHAFYATLGVAYMQQTVFLPLRVGWRW